MVMIRTASWPSLGVVWVRSPHTHPIGHIWWLAPDQANCLKARTQKKLPPLGRYFLPLHAWSAPLAMFVCGGYLPMQRDSCPLDSCTRLQAMLEEEHQDGQKRCILERVVSSFHRHLIMLKVCSQMTIPRKLHRRFEKGQHKMEWLGASRHSSSECSKTGSSCPDGGCPLLWGSTHELLVLTIWTAGAAIPDCSKGKGWALTSAFLNPDFSTFVAARYAHLNRFCRSLAALRSFQMGHLIAAYEAFEWQEK